MSLDRADMLEKNLARQTEAIRAADLKMAFLVPTATAMVGVLAALFRAAHPGVLSVLLLQINLVPMVILFVTTGLSVAPRFGAPGRSLLFFGSIADRTREEYVAEALTEDADSYLRDLATNCYTTALIARTKHRLARIAYRCFLFALPFWAVAVYVLSTEIE